MKIHEKIKYLREFNHWTQEEMAERVHMSPSGYAKIERGETKLHYDKLVQIAQIFNMNLSDLVDSDKGLFFYMNENCDNNSLTYYSNSDVIALEIEKLKLSLSHKDELLAQKDQEIQSLKKIISLLENR